MNTNRFLPYLILSITILSCSRQEPSSTENPWMISAPAGDQFTAINKTGVTVIPNGRLLTPMGKQIMVAPHPFGLTLSPDGKTIIAANSGTGPFSISIIRDFNTDTPIIKQIPEGVNHFRIGEAALLGISPLYNKKFKNLSTNTIDFSAEILELYKKENNPYKTELIENLEDGTITFCDHATFTGPNRRRCLTADEMLAKGMTFITNAHGTWIWGTGQARRDRFWLSQDESDGLSATPEGEGPGTEIEAVTEMEAS